MGTPVLTCLSCRHSLGPPEIDHLACSGCGNRYPVLDGVPILLPPELSSQHLSQAAYFDHEFERYDAYKPEMWRWSFIKRIFAELEVHVGGAPYLDVGVGGSGATVIEAARSGVDATGSDLSVQGVLQARRFAQSQDVEGHAYFVACAAEALPFATASFGSASAVAVLEHVEDDAAAARELARVIRPGGRVWITVPNAYRYIPPPIWPIYLVHDRRLGHKRHYDAATLASMMENVGFSHTKTLFSGHPIKLLQLALSRSRILKPDTQTRLWWALEKRDLLAAHRAFGALQLNAVFERV